MRVPALKPGPEQAPAAHAYSGPAVTAGNTSAVAAVALHRTDATDAAASALVGAAPASLTRTE